MATILTMNLPSDDEADSDYAMSASSSEDERENKKTKRQLKKELQLEKQRQKLKNKADSMFVDMLQESDMTYRHKNMTKPTDFMLQFHKKDYSLPGLRNAKLSELERYMSLCSSRILDDAQALDLRTFKQKCRSTPDHENLKLIHEAVRASDAIEPATIAKTYKFAGKTYTIKEHVDKTSRRYKQHTKNQNQVVGGSLAFIDDIVNELDSAPKISAIKKSEADWNQYKEDNRIDTLQQNHKFLKEQDFLHRVSWKEHENYLHARGQ
ncbi:cytochrome c oxidase copper Dopuin, putative [Babesia ovis]|uniref:Cytochrome c oxidase copper Dopuin, putative n=1 Tax=Babesia ovis TaxID=5869 RepID=A0A9W5WTE5_BABOV|nr:cytochrome c oxidase copper Dopuin, putative [Babesia ovis]